jgi:hypothetical protein
MTKEDLKDLLEGYPPNVRTAILTALEAAEEPNDPEGDVKELAELGMLLAAGAKPGAGTIIAAIGAAVSLLRWGVDKRQKRIKERRGSAVSAGLSAKRSSVRTSAQASARGAGAAWARARRK